MSTQAAPQPQATASVLKHGRGVVKMVLSGDSIIIRGQPKGGPPPEKQISLSNITAPRLARRANPNIEGSVETNDEPCAWQSRENLRKKIIGKEIYFVVDYAPTNERCYGTVYLGTSVEGENLAELQVSEGLAEVRKVNVRSDNAAHNRLIELEEQAKVNGKGKWAQPTPEDSVRNVTWTIDNSRNFVDSFHGEAIPAVIENVRDGSMMRASLPNTHHQIQFILSGIKCPMIRRDPEDPKKEVFEPYAAEAKFFVESRLLQRDVKIVLEGVSNQNLLLATVLHPNGNITELLLRDGFARCVDWSITSYTQGPEKLRAFEKQAKERNVRIWKDYVPKVQDIDPKEKNFHGKVIQILYADSIAVKLPNDTIKTIHLSSIRPPRYDDVVCKPTQSKHAEGGATKGKGRALYDVPYLLEAREFLRKKLIGKKVQVSVDYIKPASSETDVVGGFPERTCATITAGGINIAEALLSKGLVKVVRHRQDDDSRSAHYDSLLAAEQRASKTGKGLYCKKEPVSRHVTDVTGDGAKNLLPFLQRANKFEAIVEYVFSGSRLKLFLQKESRLITFLLAGIDCPRGARNGPQGVMAGDPFSEEALAFTKEYCMHRDVKVQVESIDKAGSFIGWLWIDDSNLSEMLVDRGLSRLHFTAERSSYFKQLFAAEEGARKSRINMWENWEEPKEKVVVEEPVERKANFRNVFVTEVTQQLHVYCQFADNGPKLDQLMEQMRTSLASDPPLPGSYKARRGDFCAAKFTMDDMWYRARIEKVDGERVHVHYIDFGNKEIIPAARVAALPADYNTHVLLPQANEYALALVQAPEDIDSLGDAFETMCSLVGTQQFLVNTEYKDTYDHVTLLNKDTKQDVGKSLITEGVCTVAKRGEKRLGKLLSEYYKEQDKAKKAHLNLWRYGDITADDAAEFGFKKSS